MHYRMFYASIVRKMQVKVLHLHNVIAMGNRYVKIMKNYQKSKELISNMETIF